MRLIILTQYYPPEIGAPQRRLSDMAQRFVKSGHSVTVLTAMPNYPVGRIADGYGGIVRRERIDDVTVIRTFIYPTHSTSPFLRMANYLSFVMSSLLMGIFLLPHADYLMVESPPLFLGMSGYLLSRIKSARLVFNVSDIWPSGLARLELISVTSIAYRLSSWLEAFCYRKSTLVTCQTKGIMTEVNERFPEVATYHLSNGIALEDFGPNKLTPTARAELSQNEDETILLYAGLHGWAQALEQIIDAAVLLKDEPYRFVFIGDGPQKEALQKRAMSQNLSKVVFLRPCAPQHIPALLAATDIVIVSLKESYREAVPSKLFEAMASEKPVLLVAASEACEIVAQYEAGVIAKPGDPEDIAYSIRRLGQDPELRKRLAANARRTVEQYYDRNQIAIAFATHLERIKG